MCLKRATSPPASLSYACHSIPPFLTAATWANECASISPSRQRTLRLLAGILARYAAQHVGQRHSTNFLPVSETARKRRQPWLMLIRVVSRGAGGATAPHPTQTFSGLVGGLGASEL